MLTFLTGNNHKFSEAQAILGDNLIQKDIDLPEIQSLNPQEIIQNKIQTAVTSGAVEWPFFVEDTSLVFHALDNFPWPLIKRILKHEWALGAYRLLADYQDKSATATCHIGYRNGKQTHFVSGSVTGTIVSPQWDTTFGRDPIFRPKMSPWQGGNPEGKGVLTFAQMSPEKKNSISHRSQAMKKLLKIISP